jgi:hypothetical protein
MRGRTFTLYLARTFYTTQKIHCEETTIKHPTPLSTTVAPLGLSTIRLITVSPDITFNSP